jgi:hypothetical protein
MSFRIVYSIEYDPPQQQKRYIEYITIKTKVFRTYSIRRPGTPCALREWGPFVVEKEGLWGGPMVYRVSHMRSVRAGAA